MCWSFFFLFVFGRSHPSHVTPMVPSTIFSSGLSINNKIEIPLATVNSGIMKVLVLKNDDNDADFKALRNGNVDDYNDVSLMIVMTRMKATIMMKISYLFARKCYGILGCHRYNYLK